MFDNRVEITSPGGMFGGGSIQEYDIYSIRSMRRNPVIADLFHRMKYMERRGSGLRKIVSETEKLPGYSVIYFCFRLFGLSGIVILSWPLASRGFKYFLVK